MKKNFLITTGGSGGHVIPATILYQHLSGIANVLISSYRRGTKYLDQNITVQGKVLDLCRKAGCWISIIDTQGNKITAKGNHSNIVFPINAIGGRARITGKFKKHVLSLEQTIKYEAHMAKDRGEKFDESSIKNPKNLYRIHTAGAVIFLAKQ